MKFMFSQSLVQVPVKYVSVQSGAHNEKNTPRKERETPTHLIESIDRAVRSHVTIFNLLLILLIIIIIFMGGVNTLAWLQRNGQQILGQNLQL